MAFSRRDFDPSDPLGQRPENRARLEAAERKLADFQQRLAAVLDRHGAAEEMARDDALWVDNDFRMFILGTIQSMQKFKRDSDDLAVITRVFGRKT
jgi:hypothetical protein